MLIRRKDKSQEKSQDKSQEKSQEKSQDNSQDKFQDISKNKSQDQNNARLKNIIPTNNEGTAAWQSSESKDPKDKVSKPSIERVVDAKDWVDNGSKL